MKTLLLLALVVVAVSLVDSAPGKEPKGWFQYINVPAHKEYEFGWKRGSPSHFVSRFEQAKGHRFRTRVKTGDTKSGVFGEHYWEYNHGPQQKAYAAPVAHNAYGPPKGYHSENIEVIVPRDANIED